MPDFSVDMHWVMAWATMMLLLLAGCVLPSEGREESPTRESGTTSTSTVPAQDEDTDPEVFFRQEGPDPWQGLAAIPLLAWQRDGCDPNGDAGPSGNAPLPAPFDGSVAKLVGALEEAFGASFSEVRARPNEVFAYAQTGPNAYSHAISVNRGAGPNLDLDTDFAWLGLEAASAWETINRTVAPLGAPPPDTSSLYEYPGQLSGELTWTRASPFGVAALRVLDTGNYHQTEFWLSPKPYVGAGPPGSADNSSLDEAALTFAACRFGGEHILAGEPTFGVRAASVARTVYVVKPAEASCYGYGQYLSQDVVTKAILATQGGTRHHPCAGSSATTTPSATQTSTPSA